MPLFLVAAVLTTTGLIVFGLNLQKAALETPPPAPPTTVPADAYSDAAGARAAGAFGPDRLPDILPDDATDIWVQPNRVAYFTAPSGLDTVRARLGQLGAKASLTPSGPSTGEYVLVDSRGPVTVELGVASNPRKVRLVRN